MGSKLFKIDFGGTPSLRIFSYFLCIVYRKNRVQLKTSLSHILLKVENLEENGNKALFFKPQQFYPETFYSKFNKKKKKKKKNDTKK